MEMALDAAWDIVRIPRQPQSPKMRAKLTFDKVNKVCSRTLACLQAVQGSESLLAL